jgi:O-antigen ligase
VILLYLALEFILDISEVIAVALGRDITMTGRTDVWETVLPLNPNALLGAGYESFWLGARLKAIWSVFWYQPNQAHSGYIEIYLNLGLVGLILFAVFVMAAYRRIWKPTNTVELVSLNLAIWIIMLLHNVTEAGVFKGAIWVLLLVASVAVPGSAVDSPSEASRRRMPATQRY